MGKCQYKDCQEERKWEHNGKYYCNRHYFALVNGWEWVQKYGWTRNIKNTTKD